MVRVRSFSSAPQRCGPRPLSQFRSTAWCPASKSWPRVSNLLAGDGTGAVQCHARSRRSGRHPASRFSSCCLPPAPGFGNKPRGELLWVAWLAAIYALLMGSGSASRLPLAALLPVNTTYGVAFCHGSQPRRRWPGEKANACRFHRPKWFSNPGQPAILEQPVRQTSRSSFSTCRAYRPRRNARARNGRANGCRFQARIDREVVANEFMFCKLAGDGVMIIFGLRFTS